MQLPPLQLEGLIEEHRSYQQGRMDRNSCLYVCMLGCLVCALTLRPSCRQATRNYLMRASSSVAICLSLSQQDREITCFCLKDGHGLNLAQVTCFILSSSRKSEQRTQSHEGKHHADNHQVGHCCVLSPRALWGPQTCFSHALGLCSKPYGFRGLTAFSTFSPTILSW